MGQCRNCDLSYLKISLFWGDYTVVTITINMIPKHCVYRGELRFHNQYLNGNCCLMITGDLNLKNTMMRGRC